MLVLKPNYLFYLNLIYQQNFGLVYNEKGNVLYNLHRIWSLDNRKWFATVVTPLLVLSWYWVQLVQLVELATPVLTKS